MQIQVELKSKPGTWTQIEAQQGKFLPCITANQYLAALKKLGGIAHEESLCIVGPNKGIEVAIFDAIGQLWGTLT